MYLLKYERTIYIFLYVYVIYDYLYLYQGVRDRSEGKYRIYITID